MWLIMQGGDDIGEFVHFKRHVNKIYGLVKGTSDLTLLVGTYNDAKEASKALQLIIEAIDGGVNIFKLPESGFSKITPCASCGKLVDISNSVVAEAMERLEELFICDKCRQLEQDEIAVDYHKQSLIRNNNHEDGGYEDSQNNE